MLDQRISRRRFVSTVAATSFACSYVPRRVWGANERFHVAGIGVGGKGAGEVNDVTAAGGTFVALWQQQLPEGGRDIRWARFNRPWVLGQ